jgi:hypothetical protein
VVLGRVRERLRIVRRFVRRFVRTFFEYKLVKSSLSIEIGVPSIHFEAVQVVKSGEGEWEECGKHGGGFLRPKTWA